GHREHRLDGGRRNVRRFRSQSPERTGRRLIHLALPELLHVEPCGASLAAETLAARFRMIGEDLLAGLRFASMQTVRPQFGDEIGKRARDNSLDMLHGLQMRRRHESDTKGLAIRNGSRDPWPVHELVIEIEGEVI